MLFRYEIPSIIDNIGDWVYIPTTSAELPADYQDIFTTIYNNRLPEETGPVPAGLSSEVF